MSSVYTAKPQVATGGKKRASLSCQSLHTVMMQGKFHHCFMQIGFKMKQSHWLETSSQSSQTENYQCYHELCKERDGYVRSSRQGNVGFNFQLVEFEHFFLAVPAFSAGLHIQ